MKERSNDFTRRQFIRQASLTSLALVSLTYCTRRGKKGETDHNLLSLKSDPNGYLDLPEGFTYRVISRSGDKMSDNLLVPGRPDGMGTFLDELGRVVIVCNHENDPDSPEDSPFGRSNELLPLIASDKLYDAGAAGLPGLGGTTTLVYDESEGKRISQHLSLAGTYRNCAGGITPWGSWITCEEDVSLPENNRAAKRHGYVFEVPAHAEGLVEPIPIKEMGRFNHEAVAVDPVSGCVYLTEDRGDGLLYRFVPNEKENLSGGGRLQAMALKNSAGMDTRNWEDRSIHVGQELEVVWIDLEGIDSPEDDLRYRGFELGAARFARGEGIWMGDGELYFACTNGGPKYFGQVFKYAMSPTEGTIAEVQQPGRLSLFAESEDKSVLHMCDNLTIAPWGDILLCEDNSELNHIRGINKKGEIYTLACNRSSGSEFAGITFSPTGKTLFVNIQENGETLAITGPWERLANEIG